MSRLDNPLFFYFLYFLIIYSHYFIFHLFWRFEFYLPIKSGYLVFLFQVFYPIRDRLLSRYGVLGPSSQALGRGENMTLVLVSDSISYKDSDPRLVLPRPLTVGTVPFISLIYILFFFPFFSL